MSCEEARLLLDAYVDGELSAQQERMLMEHAAECEACRKELDAAMMLRDVLKDMDEEVAVPLEAQAAWRRAVREEAKKRTVRRWTRFACAAAAALVVAFGCTFALKDSVPAKNETLTASQPEVMAIAVKGGGELIAADGERTPMMAAASAVDKSYTAWKKFETENFDQASMTIEMLVAEYSGSFTAEGEAGAMVYRIEMPYDYMEDFLNAASRIGVELDSEMVDAASDTAVIYLQVDETEP